MKNYEEFKEAVKTALIDGVGETNVQLVDDRIYLKVTEVVATTYDLRNAYEIYENQDYSDEVINELVSILLHSKDADIKQVEGLAVTVQDYDKIADKLETRLQPKKSSVGISTEVLLSIWRSVCVIDGDKVITVTDGLLKCWGKTYEDVLEKAISNTKPWKNIELIELLNMLNCQLDVDSFKDSENSEYPQMYLLRAKGTYGATVLLNKEALNTMAKKLDGDLVVLPSSIFEIIVFKADEFVSSWLNELTKMVCDVNESLVDPNDVLAWNAFYYDREREELKPISEEEAPID